MKARTNAKHGTNQRSMTIPEGTNVWFKCPTGTTVKVSDDRKSLTIQGGASSAYPGSASLKHPQKRYLDFEVGQGEVLVVTLPAALEGGNLSVKPMAEQDDKASAYGYYCGGVYGQISDYGKEILLEHDRSQWHWYEDLVTYKYARDPDMKRELAGVLPAPWGSDAQKKAKEVFDRYVEHNQFQGELRIVEMSNQGAEGDHRVLFVVPPEGEGDVAGFNW
jgi:hypothetical protein